MTILNDPDLINNDTQGIIKDRFALSVRTASRTMGDSQAQQEKIVADLMAQTEHLWPALKRLPILADVIVIANHTPETEAEAEEMVAERLADIRKYSPQHPQDELSAEQDANRPRPLARMRSYMRR